MEINGKRYYGKSQSNVTKSQTKFHETALSAYNRRLGSSSKELVFALIHENVSPLLIR